MRAGEDGQTATPDGAPAPAMAVAAPTPPARRGLRETWNGIPERWKITIYRLITFAVIVLLWWVSSLPQRSLMPSPFDTWNAFIETMQVPRLRNEFTQALGQSLYVYLVALGISTVVGIAIGLLLGGLPRLGRTLEVYVNALMATPRIAFIPLIIAFLGLFATAKIFIVFLGAVMPIIVNTYAGVRNADGELVEMARSAGASRSRIFMRILLPGSLPFIVVGLRLGATIGLINTVVAELYTAISGVGGMLRKYSANYDFPRYFVYVVVLALIGVIVTQSIRYLETRTDRWRYKGY